MLAYNNFFGWDNHSYRFAINLIFPLSILAVLGFRELIKAARYSSGYKARWIVAVLVCGLWVIWSQARIVREYVFEPRTFVNYVRSSPNEASFLQLVHEQTKSDDFILIPPEYQYPVGAAETAIVLNYSDSPGFIPDFRYLFSEEQYHERLGLFCFLFPNFPYHDLKLHTKGCKTAATSNFNILDPRLKSNILAIQGITKIATLGGPFVPILLRTAHDASWKIASTGSQGILVTPSSQVLPGSAEFKRAVKTNDGFVLPFFESDSSQKSYRIVLLGRSLGSRITRVSIDGQAVQSESPSSDLILISGRLGPGSSHSLKLSGVESLDLLHFVAATETRKFAQFFEAR